MITQTLLAICDLAELPPIIPPWPYVQVEPAWPVRVQPWPPTEYRIVKENPRDPYSATWLEPIGSRAES